MLVTEISAIINAVALPCRANDSAVIAGESRTISLVTAIAAIFPAVTKPSPGNAMRTVRALPTPGTTVMLVAQIGAINVTVAFPISGDRGTVGAGKRGAAYLIAIIATVIDAVTFPRGSNLGGIIACKNRVACIVALADGIRARRCSTK